MLNKNYIPLMLLWGACAALFLIGAGFVLSTYSTRGEDAIVSGLILAIMGVLLVVAALATSHYRGVNAGRPYPPVSDKSALNGAKRTGGLRPDVVYTVESFFRLNQDGLLYVLRGDVQGEPSYWVSVYSIEQLPETPFVIIGGEPRKLSTPRVA